jgi:hypothetical protein
MVPDGFHFLPSMNTLDWTILMSDWMQAQSVTFRILNGGSQSTMDDDGA